MHILDSPDLYISILAQLGSINARSCQFRQKRRDRREQNRKISNSFIRAFPRIGLSNRAACEKRLSDYYSDRLSPRNCPSRSFHEGKEGRCGKECVCLRTLSLSLCSSLIKFYLFNVLVHQYTTCGSRYSAIKRAIAINHVSRRDSRR